MKQFMRQRLLLIVTCLALFLPRAFAQDIKFDEARFMVGDNPEWKNPGFDDSRWRTVSIHQLLDKQGILMPHTFAWFRIHFTLTPALRSKSDLQQALILHLGIIDDADQTFLNGELVGKTGKNPKDDGEEQSMWDTKRNYIFENTSKINWNGDNVIAVRVYNGGDPGGMAGEGQGVTIANLIDGLSMNCAEYDTKKDGVMLCRIMLDNKFLHAQKGRLKVRITLPETGELVSEKSYTVNLNGHSQKSFNVNYPKNEWSKITLTYTDAKNRTEKMLVHYPKYVLTPSAPLSPRYNGPQIYGVRPGSPVIFRLPISGKRPMQYAIENLPEGLKLDTEQGILTGAVAKAGTYVMTLKASNAQGAMEQKFTLKVGDKIGLTPAMGWNSWNCWGLSVSQDKVMASAKALLERGLADYGYSYVNVDDAWEAAERQPDGRITANSKFPDMKGLGDWLHGRGLKFGIYSSPGDRTCGGYLGSLGHEQLDADTYNRWGVDYLKYDWCGYSKVWDTLKDQTVASYVRPYLLMEQYLRNQPRDIWYSLCQYGMGDVWKWGYVVDANSWRTTGDITDTWESMYEIGFESQADLYKYSEPGHWNDPDMLIVGKVGWSSELRDSRLTADEQYTHISLWALQAANMMIGCALDQIDDFTFGLLCNYEVIAVDQDVLGKAAQRVVRDGDIQIWTRPLADGSMAVGIFNLGTTETVVDFSKYYDKCGISAMKSIRDLWRQKDLDTTHTSYRIAPHGVRLLKVM